MIPIHTIRSTQHRFTRRVLFYPLLSDAAFHYSQFGAINLFFLKLFREGFVFFLFHYQTVTIMCIKKALKVLQNEKTVVSLHHN